MVVMGKLANAIFGGQRESLDYVGYGDCHTCGDDCAEMWRDRTTGRLYVRCPYIGCPGWGRPIEVEEADA